MLLFPGFLIIFLVPLPLDYRSAQALLNGEPRMVLFAILANLLMIPAFVINMIVWGSILESIFRTQKMIRGPGK